jgi:UDP-2,3-diacylglucosamine pyrophosphatase LpxH
VTHGDLFDGIILHAKWLAYMGDSMYTVILKLNNWFNHFRHKFGLSYWSLSQYLKHKVKNAVSFISDFEHTVASEARRRGYDGVVCGHGRVNGRVTYSQQILKEFGWIEQGQGRGVTTRGSGYSEH